VNGGGGEDVAALREVSAAQREEIRELREAIAKLTARLAEVERERDEYRTLYLIAREESERLKRGLIGQKAQRPPENDAQLSLAVLGLLLGKEPAVGEAPPRQLVPAHSRQKPVRKPLPERPLHRLESVYRRDGIELNRSTLCTWHAELGELVEPLVGAMRADALRQPYVCTDATGVLVQHPLRCKHGHFWVLVAPGKHVLFEFSMKHDGEAVDRFLGGYTGTIVADAHVVYDHLYEDKGGKATEAGCGSHMRKYVLEALAVDSERVREPLSCVQALFLIERTLDRAPPL
jgi:hypothetical protein